MSADPVCPASSGTLRPTAEGPWVRADGTLWRYAGLTLVLLPVGTDVTTPLVVSGSAALVWELLATPVTLTELAFQLAEVYDTNAEVITTDLASMLAELHAAAAIELSR